MRYEVDFYGKFLFQYEIFLCYLKIFFVTDYFNNVYYIKNGICYFFKLRLV